MPAAPDPAPRPGSRAAGKARTHENLLAAAMTVFAERGFAAASVEEIARTAGVSVGSVYAHFASKEALFLALLERHADAQLDAARRDQAEDFDGALRTLDRRLGEEADDGHVVALSVEAWLHALRSPDLGADLAAHWTRTLGLVENLVATERERRGVPRTMSDTEVATIISALYQGLVQRRRFMPGSVPDDLLSRTITALLAGLEDRRD